MLASLDRAGEQELCRSTLASLTSCLASSNHWTRRQTYALLTGQLLATLPWEEAATSLLPHLLTLAQDRVPNVRLQVAHVLGHVMSEGDKLLLDPSASFLLFPSVFKSVTFPPQSVTTTPRTLTTTV